MTDIELVLRKLATLQDHLQRARRRLPETIEVLTVDQDLQDALSMSLLVAIQEALDIAFHVAADEGWGIPGSYAESFEILARHGVLDGALAQGMAGAAGLRNRIAHGYATLDLPRLWAELPQGLDLLERYAQAIATFLGSAPR
jgi:uncharacterized protein YutE (UPF0331/DUF86 family)